MELVTYFHVTTDTQDFTIGDPHESRDAALDAIRVLLEKNPGRGYRIQEVYRGKKLPADRL